MEPNRGGINRDNEDKRNLTLEKARSLLGSSGDKYTDENLKILIENVYGLAEVAYKIYEKNLNK